MDPEQQARVDIDRLLEQAGWAVQDKKAINLYASYGSAVREFDLKSGHGTADYLLFVDGAAVGVVEAKPQGMPLTGVEVQSTKYSDGLRDNVPTHWSPLPFVFESTGVETNFTNRLEPDARSRPVFSFHTPQALADLLGLATPHGPASGGVAESQGQYLTPHILRDRLRHMPPLADSGLWPVQAQAIRSIEESLAAGKPRALIQMATGSGKTFMACNLVYRLVKHAGAKRVLFLV
ncbi:MAG: DEAD/DEAH box helicase family protein, partial [Chloroflexota bacterium]|nr:DEAD/DEAH box helicase family protein [Chloroflexota bacterium]